MIIIIGIYNHVRPGFVTVDIHAAIDHIRSPDARNTVAYVVNVHTDDGFLLLQSFFFCSGRHTEVDGLRIRGHRQPAGVHIHHFINRI